MTFPDFHSLPNIKGLELSTPDPRRITPRKEKTNHPELLAP